MKPFKRTVEKVLSWIANVFLILFTGVLWYIHSRDIRWHWGLSIIQYFI